MRSSLVADTCCQPSNQRLSSQFEMEKCLQSGKLKPQLLITKTSGGLIVWTDWQHANENWYVWTGCVRFKTHLLFSTVVLGHVLGHSIKSVSQKCSISKRDGCLSESEKKQPLTDWRSGFGENQQGDLKSVPWPFKTSLEKRTILVLQWKNKSGRVSGWWTRRGGG